MKDFTAINNHLNNSKCMNKIGDENMKEAIKVAFKEAWEKMENEPHIKSIAFTPHGLSHCLDILKIIEDIFYSDKISKMEWVCLLIAVAWHDVGMHGDVLTDEERKKHAINSADQCKKFIRQSSIGRIITENLQLCICEIIKGHSGKALFNIAEQTECEEGMIHVRLLAAILRFADELDVCSNRLVGEKQLYNELKEGNTEEETISRQFSFACWEQCAIFLMPKGEGTSIQLRVSLDNVRARINAQYTLSKGEINKNIYDLIERHLKKVEQSFYEDRVKDVFDSYDYGYERFQAIELVWQDQTIPDQIIDNIKKQIKKIKHNIVAMNIYEARILLRNEIKERGLRGERDEFTTKSSNINLQGEKINTYQLIQHDEKNIIPQIMYKAFGNLNERLDWSQNPVIILGVDDLGWILSSSLALMLKVPFEMVVSEHHEKYVEKKFLKRKDMLQEFIKEKNLILVIDTIYTFTTIINIIERYNLNREKILAVVSLFDRKPYARDDEDQLYMQLQTKEKIFAVIDDDKVEYYINSKESGK